MKEKNFLFAKKILRWDICEKFPVAQACRMKQKNCAWKRFYITHAALLLKSVLLPLNVTLNPG